MLSYSIAIRTLGTGGENYRRELESIARQTVQPERVVVYIADGYSAPPFRVGREEYVSVPKGMAAQRALPYDEIQSDCILLLDDDVELAPDTARRLLEAIETHDADCVAADTFANHRMGPAAKLRAAFASLALPARNAQKAFRIRRSGAFSYLSNPRPGACLESDSAAGPAAMWRKSAITAIHPEHELWVEQDGFAYGEDLVLFHKLPVNGRRLCVMFDSGAVHLNSGNSSGAFRRGGRRMYIRTKNTFIIWWRCIYEPSPDALAACAFAGRSMLNLAVAAIAAVVSLRPKLISQYVKGLRDGLRYVRSDAYAALPKYRLK